MKRGATLYSSLRSLLAAGHETTSTALAWCLYALTQAPRVQRKLRHELLSVTTEHPSQEELGALPYLDAVIRETLRVYAPITTILRAAARDDVLPVSQPFRDRYGTMQTHIR